MILPRQPQNGRPRPARKPPATREKQNEIARGRRRCGFVCPGRSRKRRRLRFAERPLPAVLRPKAGADTVSDGEIPRSQARRRAARPASSPQNLFRRRRRRTKARLAVAPRQQAKRFSSAVRRRFRAASRSNTAAAVAGRRGCACRDANSRAGRANRRRAIRGKCKRAQSCERERCAGLLRDPAFRRVRLPLR